MKKADKAYLDKLTQYGCIICRMPAEIHHLRAGMGMGQRNSHQNAISLCPRHHRTGGYGVALHAGQKAFEAKYGTEEELLAKARLISEG